MGTCESLGMVSLAKDLGIDTWGTLYTDSGAALGIAGRAGAGKVRHLDTSMLWIQQKQMREEVVFDKVKGSDNPADLWTKNVEHTLRNKQLVTIGFEFREGRADRAIELN